MLISALDISFLAILRKTFEEGGSHIDANRLAIICLLLDSENTVLSRNLFFELLLASTFIVC